MTTSNWTNVFDRQSFLLVPIPGQAAWVREEQVGKFNIVKPSVNIHPTESGSYTITHGFPFYFIRGWWKAVNKFANRISRILGANQTFELLGKVVVNDSTYLF